MKEIFPDLDAMAACLASLGAIVKAAGLDAMEDECLIRPEHRAQAITELSLLLGADWDVGHILTSLDWE